MIGFETIGNATLILHDGAPLLATDPWLSGDAYFGSWKLTYEIPEAQRASILAAKYVWLSHGHPDHLDLTALDQMRSKTILLPDHAGGRIRADLVKMGFTTRVLPDRAWTPLSDHVRVLSISDYSQNAVLLADVNGRLVANINDTQDRGWARFVRGILRRYSTTFLLKLFCYGDPDMNNFFDESGARIVRLKKFPLGTQVQFWAELYGARFVIPFSSFHCYQRTDSAWANDYVDDWPAHRDGFASKRVEVLPAFIRYDCESDQLVELAPRKRDGALRDPAEFGDVWSDPLDRDEVRRVEQYVKGFATLRDTLDFVRIRVGGVDHEIELAPVSRRGFQRGVTFEVPRGSLMTAIEYEVFDDLLIGNFMKTTLHGSPVSDFYRAWSLDVSKIGDNGRARSREEVARYMEDYRRRAPVEFLLYQLEEGSQQTVRRLLPRDSQAFGAAKKVYSMVKEITR